MISLADTRFSSGPAAGAVPCLGIVNQLRGSSLFLLSPLRLILGLYNPAEGPAGVGNSVQCLGVADQLAPWLDFDV